MGAPPKGAPIKAAERAGFAHGLVYEVITTDMGHRCGYVRIPEGHPLFRRGYSSPAPGVTRADLEGEPIGKRGAIALFRAALDDETDTVNLDLLFDVHGGLTFADSRLSKDDWWLGFDCAHAGDAPDPELMSEERQRISERYGAWDHDSVVRSAEYVEQECISLARQIAERYPLARLEGEEREGGDA